MSISARIRKAALGPTPREYEWLYGWVGWGTAEHQALKDHSVWVSQGVSEFTDMGKNTERRMYLLFVAEALESEPI